MVTTNNLLSEVPRLSAGKHPNKLKSAILEYDGGYSRGEAERLAAEELKPPGAAINS